MCHSSICCPQPAPHQINYLLTMTPKRPYAALEPTDETSDSNNPNSVCHPSRQGSVHPRRHDTGQRVDPASLTSRESGAMKAPPAVDPAFCALERGLSANDSHRQSEQHDLSATKRRRLYSPLPCEEAPPTTETLNIRSDDTALFAAASRMQHAVGRTADVFCYEYPMREPRDAGPSTRSPQPSRSPGHASLLSPGPSSNHVPCPLPLSQPITRPDTPYPHRNYPPTLELLHVVGLQSSLQFASSKQSFGEVLSTEDTSRSIRDKDMEAVQQFIDNRRPWPGVESDTSSLEDIAPDASGLIGIDNVYCTCEQGYWDSLFTTGSQPLHDWYCASTMPEDQRRLQNQADTPELSPTSTPRLSSELDIPGSVASDEGYADTPSPTLSAHDPENTPLSPNTLSAAHIFYDFCGLHGIDGALLENATDTAGSSTRVDPTTSLDSSTFSGAGHGQPGKIAIQSLLSPLIMEMVDEGYAVEAPETPALGRWRHTQRAHPASQDGMIPARSYLRCKDSSRRKKSKAEREDRASSR